MKYKAGDKVKIKTWEEMEKEFGLGMDGNINCEATFVYSMEKFLDEYSRDRIMTIKNEDCFWYCMEEEDHYWSDDMIKCLALKPEQSDNIEDRFEILDL